MRTFVGTLFYLPGHRLLLLVLLEVSYFWGLRVNISKICFSKSESGAEEEICLLSTAHYLSAFVDIYIVSFHFFRREEFVFYVDKPFG